MSHDLLPEFSYECPLCEPVVKLRASTAWILDQMVVDHDRAVHEIAMP